MPTQPNTPNWSEAVQRELDSLQRNVDTRFVDFSSRLDRLLTLTEYYADKRSSDIRFENINEKIEDTESDIEALRLDLRNSFESLRRDLMKERNRYEASLNKETTERKKEHSDYLKSRQSQFRWLISMVMIPITIAIVDLVVSKK